MCADVDKKNGRDVTSSITGEGNEAIFISADVSRSSDVESLVKETVKAYGGLDVLFNNAGINIAASVVEQSEEDWDRIIGVNLKGVFLGMKYGIPVMLERGEGAIINTSSVMGQLGAPRLSAYCASKAGVVALTYSAAAAFAKDNIRVNCISPGMIETPFHSRKRPLEEVRPMFSARIPQGRMGLAEEVARTVLFLASDDASHITAVNIPVDGGYTNVAK